MKTKKFLAGILATVMTLSLAVVPAAALTFPDIQNHWAKPFIEEMTDAELFAGFEDGTFRPDQQMDTAMSLAVCARIAVPKELRKTIGADRLKEIQSLFPTPEAGKKGSYWWYYTEFAVCLEVGILSHDELAAIVRDGALDKPLTKAQFSCYLVRAMGLESVARSMGASNLTFVDADQIPEKLQPYVCLLNLYGMVEGNELGQFLPNSSVTRGVVSTMLSRALGEIKNRKISIELPRYTTCQYDAGYIVDTVAGTDGAAILSLKSDIAGAEQITIPAAVKVYQDNGQVERSALKGGAYARVCYNKDGVAESIRITAADRIEKPAGFLTSITQDELSLGGKKYTIDRFTQVEAGGKKGDSSIIDLGAGYKSATATVDILGNVLTVKLTGGTRVMEGILEAVETAPSGTTTITLAAYDGTTQRLTVPVTAIVTATGGLPTALVSGTVGRHLTLRVDDDNVNNISAIAVDTASKYVQGVLRGTATKDEVSTVAVANVSTNKVTTYTLSKESTISYNGVNVTLGSLTSGSFVTAKVEGAMITELSVWPGATYTDGILTNIAYGEPTVLEVTKSDGAVSSFRVAATDLENINITRSDKKSDITQLRTGDSVTVTVQYNHVTRIEATPKSANVTGTVQSITHNATGASIALLTEAGEAKTYQVLVGTTVTQGGNVVSLKAIDYGAKLALVTGGDQVLSIEVLQNVESTTMLKGTVFQVKSRSQITLLVVDGTGVSTPVTVRIPSNVNVSDTGTGGTVSVTEKLVGAQLMVWGSYDKLEFSATTIVKVG